MRQACRAAIISARSESYHAVASAFAAGAGPLLLEILSDPRVAAAERGRLVDVTLHRMAPVEVLRPISVGLDVTVQH
ncbi:MAG: hypothetical protein ACE5G8_07850, partial [Anaerolineae bacterium]